MGKIKQFLADLKKYVKDFLQKSRFREHCTNTEFENNAISLTRNVNA